jgi:hypothetical protein
LLLGASALPDDGAEAGAAGWPDGATVWANAVKGNRIKIGIIQKSALRVITDQPSQYRPSLRFEICTNKFYMVN